MRRLLSVLVLAAVVNAMAEEAIPVSGEAVAGFERIDAMMLDLLRAEQAPGASICIAKDERILYSRGFGFADAEARELLKPDALFRIASISKPITAVAILRLVQEGKLKLTDRASMLLGWETATDRRMLDIHVRDLLQHTGGWDRDKSGDPMFKSREIAKSFDNWWPADQAMIIKYMLTQRLDFNPGDKYAYSNFGYCVLGRIIEKVSGMPYDKYVIENVLRPLGVSGMSLGRTLKKFRQPREVVYHDAEKEKRTPDHFMDAEGPDVSPPYGRWCIEAMDAHGGWLASAEDLVKFAASFDPERPGAVLTKDSITEMFLTPNIKSNYACGWTVRRTANGKVTAWHNGALDGTSTLLVRRADGWTYAILFNARSGASGKELSSLVDPKIYQLVDQLKAPPP